MYHKSSYTRNGEWFTKILSLVLCQIFSRNIFAKKLHSTFHLKKGQNTAWQNFSGKTRLKFGNLVLSSGPGPFNCSALHSQPWNCTHATIASHRTPAYVTRIIGSTSRVFYLPATYLPTRFRSPTTRTSNLSIITRLRQNWPKTKNGRKEGTDRMEGWNRWNDLDGCHSYILILMVFSLSMVCRLTLNTTRMLLSTIHI